MDDQDIELDYGYLAQNALRSVIYEALKVTETLGNTPGEHHFYIEFLTSLPGVTLSPALKASYPDRMTIVLQHSFEDLSVTDDAFSVTLKFGGVPERLHIPFEAITSFEDPSVTFGLRFESFAPPGSYTLPDPEDGAALPFELQQPPTSADIVSLDRFRKD